MFKKFVIVISTILTIALCCVGLVGCNAGKNVDDIDVDEILNNFDVVIDDSNVEHTFEGTMLEPALRLSSGTYVASANGVSKTLTAKVYPEDSTNVEVDWSIAWSSGSLINEDISNYLLLEVAEDGSRVCTVTCIKGFEGSSATITVTTRDGGFKASCLCTYVGTPTALSLDFDGTVVGNSSSVSVTNGTYNGNIIMTNDLGSSIDGSNAIGSAYGEYEISALYASVKYYVTVDYVLNGSVVQTEDILIDTTDSLNGHQYTISASYVDQTFSETIDLSTFATASISGDTLTVNINKTQGSALYGSSATRTGWRVYYKGAYVDPRGDGEAQPCMIIVEYKEKVSGLTSMVTFNMVTSASSVSLEPSSLEF